MSNIERDLASVLPVLERGALDKRFAVPADYERDTSYEMPNTIHLFWIGSELPEHYIKNVESYRDVNSRHQIVLWVDRPRTAINGVSLRQIQYEQLSVQDLYDAEPNLGAKVDIASYDIVHRHGGIYCDIDSTALRPFDELFRRTFVAATLNPRWSNICHGIFGASRRSRWLAFVLSSLRKHYPTVKIVVKDRDIPARTGPTFFTTCFVSYADPKIRILDQRILIERHPDSYTFHSNDANWL